MSTDFIYHRVPVTFTVPRSEALVRASDLQEGDSIADLATPMTVLDDGYDRRSFEAITNHSTSVTGSGLHYETGRFTYRNRRVGVIESGTQVEHNLRKRSLLMGGPGEHQFTVTRDRITGTACEPGDCSIIESLRDVKHPLDPYAERLTLEDWIQMHNKDFYVASETPVVDQRLTESGTDRQTSSWYEDLMRRTLESIVGRIPFALFDGSPASAFDAFVRNGRSLYDEWEGDEADEADEEGALSEFWGEISKRGDVADKLLGLIASDEKGLSELMAKTEVEYDERVSSWVALFDRVKSGMNDETRAKMDKLVHDEAVAYNSEQGKYAWDLYVMQRIGPEPTTAAKVIEGSVMEGKLTAEEAHSLVCETFPSARALFTRRIMALPTRHDQVTSRNAWMSQPINELPAYITAPLPCDPSVETQEGSEKGTSLSEGSREGETRMSGVLHYYRPVRRRS